MENTHGRDLVERGNLCERKNGRGVDTNRNWDIDWGKKEKDYDPRCVDMFGVQGIEHSQGQAGLGHCTCGNKDYGPRYVRPYITQKQKWLLFFLMIVATVVQLACRHLVSAARDIESVQTSACSVHIHNSLYMQN